MNVVFPIPAIYLGKRERRIFYMTDYEKEIFSSTIPLSKKEILEVIEKSCHISTDETEINVPGYFYHDKENKLFIFHIVEFPKFDADKMVLIIPEGEPKRPEYLGYVEILEKKKHIEKPVQIRLVSYFPEIDLWWVRLKMDIENKVDRIVPGFFSMSDPNITAYSSIYNPPETEVVLRNEEEVNQGSRIDDLLVDPTVEFEWLRSQLPKNKTRLAKWIFIANNIDPLKFPGGLKQMDGYIKDNYPGFPHSREVLSIIFRAKDAGLLDPPKSENQK